MELVGIRVYSGRAAKMHEQDPAAFFKTASFRKFKQPSYRFAFIDGISD